VKALYVGGLTEKSVVILGSVYKESPMSLTVRADTEDIDPFSHRFISNMSDIPLLPLLINGKPYNDASAKVATHYSANNHGKAYVNYISATPEAAHAAAAASFATWKTYSKTPATQRRAMLQKLSTIVREDTTELVKMQVEETNCAKEWAERNIHFTTTYLDEIAAGITEAIGGHIPVCEVPGQMALVYKEPIGPILSIPPYGACLLACTFLEFLKCMNWRLTYTIDGTQHSSSH
jgi:hypothetical protein